jgi:hypothetical protein
VNVQNAARSKRLPKFLIGACSAIVGDGAEESAVIPFPEDQEGEEITIR